MSDCSSAFSPGMLTRPCTRRHTQTQHEPSRQENGTSIPARVRASNSTVPLGHGAVESAPACRTVTLQAAFITVDSLRSSVPASRPGTQVRSRHSVSGELGRRWIRPGRYADGIARNRQRDSASQSRTSDHVRAALAAAGSSRELQTCCLGVLDPLDTELMLGMPFHVDRVMT
jgi:hypothetical protein